MEITEKKLNKAANGLSRSVSRRRELDLRAGEPLVKTDFVGLVVVVNGRKAICCVGSVIRRQETRVRCQAALLHCAAVDRQASRWSERTRLETLNVAIFCEKKVRLC